MRFRAFDSLRVFEVVARHRNFGAAAAVLHLSKGAVSYQIARLEEELGFAVFDRQPRGVVLTSRGAALLEASRPAFADLERRIDGLRGDGGPRITIGMATYFAARWLSPRLGDFLAGHPGTALRLQPLIDLVDLRAAGIDMAIRWGRGAWNDMAIEPLLPRPAFVTGGVAIAQRVREEGWPRSWPMSPCCTTGTPARPGATGTRRPACRWGRLATALSFLIPTCGSRR